MVTFFIRFQRTIPHRTLHRFHPNRRLELCNPELIAHHCQNIPQILVHLSIGHAQTIYGRNLRQLLIAQPNGNRNRMKMSVLPILFKISPDVSDLNLKHLGLKQ
jgi:hypothetical protein